MKSSGLYKTLERSSMSSCDPRVVLISRVYFRVVKNLVSEHKVMKMVLGCLKTTSNRFLFIGVSHDTPMSLRLWDA